MEAIGEKCPPTYGAGVAWSGLLILYGGLLGIGFVFHFLPPILPEVIADLAISHGRAGLLMSTFALPGILFSLPAGWLVDRYGERAVGSLGLAVMGAATLGLARAGSFELILFMRFLSGVGSMVGIVGLQRMIVRLFEGRPLGLPMGIGGSAIPLGIVIILNVAGPWAETHGWREVAWRTGLVTVVIAAGFMLAARLLLRGPLRDESAGPAGPATGRGYRAIWIAGVIWAMTNGAMTAFVTFAPDHYLDLGLGTGARGVFTSLPMWISALLGPVTGIVADRRQGKAALVAWGMVLMAVGLLAATGAGVSPVLVGIALGASMALIVTPLLSMVGEVLPAAHVGRGFGILASCGNLGIFLFPPAAGRIRDLSGGYAGPFLFLAGLALAGAVAAEMLRRGGFLPGWRK